MQRRCAFGGGFSFTGRKLNCINLGSFNYLGFAEKEGECADAVEKSTRELGTGVSSSRMEIGGCYPLPNVVQKVIRCS